MIDNPGLQRFIDASARQAREFRDEAASALDRGEMVTMEDLERMRQELRLHGIATDLALRTRNSLVKRIIESMP